MEQFYLLAIEGETGGKIKTHAERVAIEKLSHNQLSGSSLYTTLEPCTELSYNQKKLPCSDLICESGISKVHIGILDANNSEIYTRGIKKLYENGINYEFFQKNI